MRICNHKSWPLFISSTLVISAILVGIGIDRMNPSSRDCDADESGSNRGLVEPITPRHPRSPERNGPQSREYSGNTGQKESQFPDDPLAWVSLKRLKETGPNTANCLNLDGSVSVDCLSSLGVPESDIGRVIGEIDRFKSELKSIIQAHIEVDESNSDSYFIGAYRDEVVPHFAEMAQNLTSIIGNETTLKVIAAYPVGDAPGGMGLLDSQFRVAVVSSAAEGIEGEIRVTYECHDPIQNVTGRSKIYWDSFKAQVLMNIVEFPDELCDLAQPKQ